MAKRTVYILRHSSFCDLIYTVGHKKRDTFIFVITLANINLFS